MYLCTVHTVAFMQNATYEIFGKSLFLKNCIKSLRWIIFLLYNKILFQFFFYFNVETIQKFWRKCRSHINIINEIFILVHYYRELMKYKIRVYNSINITIRRQRYYNQLDILNFDYRGLKHLQWNTFSIKKIFSNNC